MTLAGVVLVLGLLALLAFSPLARRVAKKVMWVVLALVVLLSVVIGYYAWRDSRVKTRETEMQRELWRRGVCASLRNNKPSDVGKFEWEAEIAKAEAALDTGMIWVDVAVASKYDDICPGSRCKAELYLPGGVARYSADKLEQAAKGACAR